MRRNVGEIWLELKRRHVVRVAIAYAVVAFALMQGAGAFLPALGTPPWILRTVAIVLIVGFPVAIVLAWVFDITTTASRVEPDGGPGVPPDAGRPGLPLTAIVAALCVFLGAAAFAVIAFRNRAPSTIDAEALVILPFRAHGDATVTGMREGMIDLLTAKFNGDVGPRSIDQNVVLAKWRQFASSDDADATPTVGARIARSLGAGKFLLGDIVGSNGTITLHATLHDAETAKSTISADASGPADSLLSLTDKVVATLLKLGAGEDRQRLAALTSVSLPAVRSYLAGQANYRRGVFDKSGRFYQQAIDIDSTFALAALGLYNISFRSPASALWDRRDAERAKQLAFQYRDRLPPRDHDYLVAALGSRYPARMTQQEILDGWRSYLLRWRDTPEAWYGLGGLFDRSGARLGIVDAADSAATAFRHTLALDPEFAPALYRLIELDVRLGDTLSLRSDSRRYFELAPEKRTDSYIAWIAAAGLQDSIETARLRTRIDSMPRQDLRDIADAERTGLIPFEEGHPAEVAFNKGEPPSFARSQMVVSVNEMMNEGRPVLAARTTYAALQSYGSMTRFAIHPEMDSAALDNAFTSITRSPFSRSTMGCMEALFRASFRNPVSMTPFIAALRSDTIKLPVPRSYIEACIPVLEAVEAINTKSPDSKAKLARADSALKLDLPFGETLIYAVVHLHEVMGDDRGALAAAGRLKSTDFMYAAPMFLETARIRARLGDKSRAARDYRRYLAMRPHPEPGKPAANVAAAQKELAALAGEGRR